MSRHQPVVSEVRLPTQDTEYTMRDPVSDFCNINWKRANVESIQRYRDILDNESSFQNLANHNFESTHSINNAYEAVVRTLKYSAKQSFPIKKYKPFLKPYWTEELTTLHKSMMASRKRWLDAGRPRGRNHDVFFGL